MPFTKKDTSYKITRITDNRDNILGVSFDNNETMNSIKNNIGVVQWDLPNIDNTKIRTSKKEILHQVISSLNSINEALGTSYKFIILLFRV